MKPRCHNRSPAIDSYTRHGFDQQTGQAITVTLPKWFVDRCTQYDGRGIGPNGESYPVAHGFDCTGCRWLPEAEKMK